MEHFVIIVNGWKPLTIITKSSILDVAAALDPPLISACPKKKEFNQTVRFSLYDLKLMKIDYYVQVDDWKIQSTLTTILPRRDWIIKLIVRHYHERVRHISGITIHQYSWHKDTGSLDAEKKYVNEKISVMIVDEGKYKRQIKSWHLFFISLPQKTFVCLCKNCCRLFQTFYHYPK